MKLLEILLLYTTDKLKSLADFCGCSNLRRRDDLISCLFRTLTDPELLRQLWRQLDDLSQKAVTAAYHNGGELDATAFVAQYGSLPPRHRKSNWTWQAKPIRLDLFLYDPGNRHAFYIYDDAEQYHLAIPTDLMPLLADIVPPPERFRLEGIGQAPATVQVSRRVRGRLATMVRSVELIQAEVEQPGWHDLMAYLRLVDEGQIKVKAASGQATAASIRRINENLLRGDFFPLSGNYRAAETIRPFGLDVFARQGGLVVRRSARLELSESGQRFYRAHRPDLLLAAFKRWVEEGAFDELERISGLRRQRSAKTHLNHPARRREAIVEALAWSPVGEWVNIEDFYRAIKIWGFDFAVETGQDTNLQTEDGSPIYERAAYWSLVKCPYINVVLWEYLGTIGALDLLYTYPQDAPPRDYYYDPGQLSRYDGLRFVRVNNLGAYLFGQADRYAPAYPHERPLLVIGSDLEVAITEPEQFTSNARSLLEQMALPLTKNSYRLDRTRLLSALEAGYDLECLVDFLHRRHVGPVPGEVLPWLEEVRQRIGAFQQAGPARLIRTRSAEQANLALADPVLGRFCRRVEDRLLVIPANKEQSFRARLKELGYPLL